MPTQAIVPKSIAMVKKATLTPHFNLATLQLSCEQTKTSLFACCRPEDIQLIFSENYYELYFYLTGKYTIDYKKKHSLIVELDEKIDKLYVAGKEIISQPTDSEKAVFKIAAEQHAHVQKEIALILDKRRREVEAITMPFLPSNLRNMSLQKCQKFDIPRKLQIDLLRSKIAIRPPDVASVEKEILEITQRIIVYFPMCRFTFENKISHEEATVSLNRVTGEIDSIAHKKSKSAIYTKLPNTASSNTQTTANLLSHHNQSFIQDEIERLQKMQVNDNPEISLEGVPENNSLGFPAEIGGETFSVGDNVTAVVGDIAIASGSIIDKSLVVKGSIKIGDNCIANGKLKVLRDVVIGTETVINGDIVAGGNVFIGTLSTVKGRVEATGFVRINEGATVEKGLHCFFKDLEYDKRNLEKLREDVIKLKAECAELNECIRIEVLAEDGQYTCDEESRILNKQDMLYITT